MFQYLFQRSVLRSDVLLQSDFDLKDLSLTSLSRVPDTHTEGVSFYQGDIDAFRRPFSVR